MNKAQLVKNPDGQAADCVAMAENSIVNIHSVDNGPSNGQELYEDRLGRKMNNEKISPLDELDEVARREREHLEWQFQSLHKEYTSEYCKDKLVQVGHCFFRTFTRLILRLESKNEFVPLCVWGLQDAKNMIDSDTASMAMHDTFASYKVGTFVSESKLLEHCVQSFDKSSTNKLVVVLR
jgi:hypothetical protein